MVKASAKPAVKAGAKPAWALKAPYGFAGLALLLLGALLWRRWRKSPRRQLSSDGYVLVGGQREHRLIAQSVLGRALAPGEVVHHINGIKTDNRESNLCVMDAGAHDAFHEWLRRKVASDRGRYPAKNYQRALLRHRYGGILLGRQGVQHSCA